MRINRERIRKLILQEMAGFVPPGGQTSEQKLARAFKETGDNRSMIRHFFELAVTLGHAAEGSLELETGLGGDKLVVIMVTSLELADILDRIMDPVASYKRYQSTGWTRVNLGPDPDYPGMYFVAYVV